MKFHAKQFETKLAMIAVILLFICMACPRAFSATSEPADMPVYITVEPIAEISPSDPDGIVMTTVTNDWMNRTRTTQGSIGVNVVTNYSGTLRCLDTVSLVYESASYTVPVGIMLSGVSTAYYSGEYICLDFEPGAYEGPDAPVVAASLTKTWSWDDAPGTYQGIVTLEFVPR